MVISFSIKDVLANQKNKLNEARNKKTQQHMSRTH